MQFWLYICSHSVSKIRTEGKNFWIYLSWQKSYKKTVQNDTFYWSAESCIRKYYASRDKLSHFDLKSWVTGGIKFDPAKWVTEEYLSQFVSQCWVNLTLNVESIWLSMLSQFDSQCWVNLTLSVESIWLSVLSQFDSQCWVNLTLNVESNLIQIFSSYPLCHVEF